MMLAGREYEKKCQIQGNSKTIFKSRRWKMGL